jgi:hypothetical protein
MTADNPAPIGVCAFLDWIVALAEGRAANVEPAALKVTFNVRICARASPSFHGRRADRRPSQISEPNH